MVRNPIKESEFQIKESELEMEKGKAAAVGIGRVKIPKMSGFNFEIPLLSFIVILETENGATGKRNIFIASCIHLRIEGYGNSDEEAIMDMIDNICLFLYKNFCDSLYKNTCWSNILRLFKADRRSSSLWDKYHTIQLMFAERDFTTDSYSLLQKKIDALNAKVKKLEKEAEMEKMKKLEKEAEMEKMKKLEKEAEKEKMKKLFESVTSINRFEENKNPFVPVFYKLQQDNFLQFNQGYRRSHNVLFG